MNTARIISITVIGTLLAPAFALAATMGIAPVRTSVVVGQPFEVDVTLNTQGEPANAVKAEVTFPPRSFTLQGVNDGSSPIDLWIEPPREIASGTVEFSGIVPGGITAAGSIVGLILVPTAPGTGAVQLSDVSLLANDGEGTPIPVTTAAAAIDVAPAPASGVVPQGPSFPYTTPQVFTPVIAQDPNVYDGEYFLVFSTTDKGSGIAYYQVLETPAGAGIGQSPAWVTATSPYLLQDQTLSSDIYVRAVNNAGNSIIVKVPARHPAAPWHGAAEAGVAAALGLVVIAVGWWFRRRMRKRRAR